MSIENFNQRINRINSKTYYTASDRSGGEGSTVLMYSSPLPQKKSVRRSWKPAILGIVLGMIVGVLLAGSVNPDSLWGPGTDYVGYVKFPSTMGLVAAPFLAVVGVVFQNKFPNFFGLTVGYFPAVMIAAMFSEDLTGMVQNIPLNF